MAEPYAAVPPASTRQPWARGCLAAILSPASLFRRLFARASEALSSVPYEYQSPERFLGLPLLHVNVGFDTPGGRMRRARGIIAMGNEAVGIVAIGLVGARGVVAVAPVAVGVGAISVASAALVSVSVFGLGVVSCSVFAVGILSVGIVSLGAYSVGILAIGRNAVGIVGLGQTVRALFGR